MSKKKQFFSVRTSTRRNRAWLVFMFGSAVIVLLSVLLFFLVVSGKMRKTTQAQTTTPSEVSEEATSTITTYLSRRLDGVLVPKGQESFTPRLVMIDNYISAGLVSGLSQASVVIEAPVEGGITRFLAFFDATVSMAEIGPVRSARPYFVDWAQGWQSFFFHVGGSPEALRQLRLAKIGRFHHVDEMIFENFFWRSQFRLAPHSTFTSSDFMSRAEARFDVATDSMPVVWHFQEAASSTDRGGVTSISIPYRGSFYVRWKFDRDRGVYARLQGGVLHRDAEQMPIEAENVIVLKTNARVIDDVGRLKMRTIGSGEAVAYRDGNKHILRWRRGFREPIRFETVDGNEFLLTRGRTWIEVTTDDLTFSGIER